MVRWASHIICDQLIPFEYLSLYLGKFPGCLCHLSILESEVNFSASFQVGTGLQIEVQPIRFTSGSPVGKARRRTGAQQNPFLVMGQAGQNKLPIVARGHPHGRPRPRGAGTRAPTSSGSPFSAVLGIYLPPCQIPQPLQRLCARSQPLFQTLLLNLATRIYVDTKNSKEILLLEKSYSVVIVNSGQGGKTKCSSVP